MLTNLLQHADSLRFTSAISILLAVVFMLISLGIAVYALLKGTATMPRMLPDFSRLSSPFELFTAVPVIVVAFTFHFNGSNCQCNVSRVPCAARRTAYESIAHLPDTDARARLTQCTRSARS